MPELILRLLAALAAVCAYGALLGIGTALLDKRKTRNTGGF